MPLHPPIRSLVALVALLCIALSPPPIAANSKFRIPGACMRVAPLCSSASRPLSCLFSLVKDGDPRIPQMCALQITEIAEIAREDKLAKVEAEKEQEEAAAMAASLKVASASSSLSGGSQPKSLRGQQSSNAASPPPQPPPPQPSSASTSSSSTNGAYRLPASCREMGQACEKAVAPTLVCLQALVATEDPRVPPLCASAIAAIFDDASSN